MEILRLAQGAQSTALVCRSAARGGECHLRGLHFLPAPFQSSVGMSPPVIWGGGGLAFVTVPTSGRGEDAALGWGMQRRLLPHLRDASLG